MHNMHFAYGLPRSKYDFVGASRVQSQTSTPDTALIYAFPLLHVVVAAFKVTQ